MGEDATIPETPSAAAAKKRVVQLPSRYRIIDVLGEGGMGRVYRAYDATLGREVAIKVIENDLPGPDKTLQRERFVREARAAARLIHPNIVAMHDVDPEAGWLVMELVEGVSLRELANHGALAPALVRTIAEQVLAGLGAAHAVGVIHRDVKPSNIILGAGDKVTLVDFGVARLLDVELTRTGEGLGTPAYMAPEQIRGVPVDARTDLYGLGATLYELVTGTRMIAFESPTAEALARVREACAGDDGLAAVIVRCVQGEPSARFPTAGAALAALRAKPRRLPSGRRLAAVGAVLAVAAGATLGVRWWLGRSAKDPRPALAFTLAQRGENERASGILEGYLAEHPGDTDARTVKFLSDWWEGGVVDTQRTIDAQLRTSQRAMVHGIDLITQRRETEAVAYLEAAAREEPDAVEVLYALGEARWHGQRLEDGAATLERAFRLDPRWEMALHHVVEFRLSRGEAPKLRPIADQLRAVDAAAAAALDCKIAIGELRYGDAITGARAALAEVEAIPEIYLCLSQAQALTGDLDGGMKTAKQAFDLWPIDLREWGGFAQYAEYFLYRGKLDEYVDLLGGKPSRQRSLALSLWRPKPGLTETPPAGPGMRMPPLGAATWILVGQTQARDEIAVYGTYPEPEVRAYGEGLWAETRGDPTTAIARYRHALDVPAKGDLRMLLAHHLARVLHVSGDHAGATAACKEVIAPRMYQGYRAILLPDCLAWSDDPAGWKQLVDAWQGAFPHPAVALAKRRLATP